MSGTVKIHGKEYKTVALRIQEFREKHPDFTIQTELVEANDVLVVMKATISMAGLKLLLLATLKKLEQRARSTAPQR